MEIKRILLLSLFTVLLMAQDKSVFSQYSLDEALSLAASKGKPVMVKFHADWCHFCRKMDRVTFTNKNVQEAMNDYYSVKVDIETKEGMVYARQYGVTALPTIVMFDKNGEKLYHQTGFHSAEQLEKVLNKGHG